MLVMSVCNRMCLNARRRYNVHIPVRDLFRRVPSRAVPPVVIRQSAENVLLLLVGAPFFVIRGSASPVLGIICQAYLAYLALSESRGFLQTKGYPYKSYTHIL